MKRQYGRIVRSEVYFAGTTVYVRIFHVATDLTLATDNTGAKYWRSMVDYGHRHAEAYEIVLRHGNTVQTVDGTFVGFYGLLELR